MRRLMNAVLFILTVFGTAAVATAETPRPRAAVDAGSTTFGGGTYTYDAAGNIIAIDNQQFLYDTTGRITQAKVQAPDLSYVTQTYTYDVYGNLLTMSRTGSAQTMSVDAATNHLNTNAATYDAAGDLTQWQVPGSTATYKYDWDGLGNLQAIKALGESVPRTAYVYTADDERLEVIDVAASLNQWTVRDFTGRVLSDFQQQGSTWAWTRDYYYRDASLLASRNPTVTQHYSLDHLGSPRLVTDDSGYKLAAQTFLPFGEELPPCTGCAATFQNGDIKKFTGHERDADPLGTSTFLDYMHARYYNGAWGRFLSVDPQLDVEASREVPQKWNRYTYGRNNPMRFNDPNGRDEREGWKAGVVVNHSSQAVTIAGDVKGHVQVVQLQPGQSSESVMQDADAIIPNNQTMRFGPAGIEQISEAPDVKDGAIKIGFGKVEVHDTSNKTLRLSTSIGYMLSVFGFHAGVVTPATAQKNGWLVPQQQQQQSQQAQPQQQQPQQQQQQATPPEPVKKKSEDEHQ